MRLYCWRGWTTTAEPIVLILHLAYLFVPLGFLAIAASALRGHAASATHVMTVGTVATMMFAVMTWATRGHTGRELTSSCATNASYAASRAVSCALIRPLTGFPEYAMWLYPLAGSLWMERLRMYLHEYAPMLLKRWRQARWRGMQLTLSP